MTEEMIKEYLEHHFEPNPADNFRTEDEQRVLDPYPHFQSIGLTHHLSWWLFSATLHFCNTTLNRMLPMCKTDMTPHIPKNPRNHTNTAHGRQRWCPEALHA